jgi:glycine cleavage system H protein
MERRFSKEHLWILQEGNKAKIGISDYAQEKLGNILFLNLPDEEDELIVGSVFGDIESVKTVSDLIAPLSGRVVAVNEDLIDEPDAINEEPYESWFVEVELADLPEDLMTENDYKEFVNNL